MDGTSRLFWSRMKTGGSWTWKKEKIGIDMDELKLEIKRENRTFEGCEKRESCGQNVNCL